MERVLTTWRTKGTAESAMARISYFSFNSLKKREDVERNTERGNGQQKMRKKRGHCQEHA